MAQVLFDPFMSEVLHLINLSMSGVRRHVGANCARFILGAVRDLRLSIVAVFGLGCLVGILSFSHVPCSLTVCPLCFTPECHLPLTGITKLGFLLPP